MPESPANPAHHTMNTQRILHRLIRVALMVGMVALLPSLQAKSVSVLDAITPLTAPPQKLTREVSQPPAPHARPQAGGAKLHQRLPADTEHRPGAASIQRDESFDTTRFW